MATSRRRSGPTSRPDTAGASACSSTPRQPGQPDHRPCARQVHPRARPLRVMRLPVVSLLDTPGGDPRDNAGRDSQAVAGAPADRRLPARPDGGVHRPRLRRRDRAGLPAVLRLAGPPTSSRARALGLMHPHLIDSLLASSKGAGGRLERWRRRRRRLTAPTRRRRASSTECCRRGAVLRRWIGSFSAPPAERAQLARAPTLRPRSAVNGRDNAMWLRSVRSCGERAAPSPVGYPARRRAWRPDVSSSHESTARARRRHRVSPPR